MQEPGADVGPEQGADSVIGLYRRHADAFMAARSTGLAEKAWIDRFLAVAGPGGHILDVGCGSGNPLAIHMAGQGHAVTGVDSSPELLAAFAGNLPSATAYLADMRMLSLGKQFAGVLAWDSLFHLSQTDQRLMLARLADHAAPGAALMFTSGTVDGTSIGWFEGEPLFHASLAADAYRTLLEAAGFSLVAHQAEDPDCGGRTIWLFRKGQGPGAVSGRGRIRMRKET
jgi:2-polyprenyl-3-methyl-5-hydroxy-6-metoxy-1,4-benzoquinol methylase